MIRYISKFESRPAQCAENLLRSKKSMSRNKTVLFLSLFFLIIHICCNGFEDLGGGYYRKDDEIFFKLKKEHMKVKNMHAATFKHIAYGYTSDKNGIYWERDPICGVDQKSFQVLSAQYSKDSQAVYYLGTRIDSAHASSFEVICVNFGKDAKSAFNEGFAIKNSDPITFEVLTNVKEVPHDEEDLDLQLIKYSRDKENGYYNHRIMEGANPQGLRLLGFMYATDGKNVYHQGYKLNTTMQGFFLHNTNRRIGVDTIGNKIFLFGREIHLDVDAKSFEVLGENYYKDIKNVYFMHGGRNKFWIVEGADPKTFKVLKHFTNGDAKDKNHIFFLGEKNEG